MALHASAVQASSSLQSTAGLEHPPVAPSQTSSVQLSSSPQSTAPGALSQVPSAGLQESVVQASPSLQSTAPGALSQVPSAALQESVVQASLSSQSTDSFTHSPVISSQESAVQGSPSSQSLGEPEQTPPLQKLSKSQGLPEQATPSSASAASHVPVSGWQARTWHSGAVWSEQSTTVAGSAAQVPSMQFHVPLHRSPSSKAMHSSPVVQSQGAPRPGLHSPSVQKSCWPQSASSGPQPVQGSPSSHSR